MSRFQFVGKSLEIEACPLGLGRSSRLLHKYGLVVVGVTSPIGMGRFGIVQRSSTLRRYGIKMVGEAGSGQGREHAVCKHEVSSVGKIVWNFGFCQLRIGQEIAVEVPVPHVVEFTHGTAIDGGSRILPTVPDVIGHLIWSPS